MQEFQKPETKSSKVRSVAEERRRGGERTLCLKLHSAEGLDLLRRYPDNWPKASLNIFQHDGYPQLDRQKSPEDGSCSSRLGYQTSSKPYLLRHRDIKAVEAQQPVNCNELDSQQTDFTGHPAGRGCKGCFQLGERCPLLEPKAKYPCSVCVGDGCDCELLTAPRRKKRCEECKKKGRKCSFLIPDWGDHSQACYHCALNKFRCLAGPADDPLRRRLPDFVPPNALNHCSPAQTRDNTDHTTTNTKPSRKRCESFGMHSDGPHRTKSRKIEHKSIESTKVSSSIGASKSPKTISITTKLVHPITFWYVPPVDGTQPCHWCYEPFYGVMGRQTKKVQVSEESPGRYIEISGGHMEDGCEPSRVCIEHTQHFSRIIACPSHCLKRVREHEVGSKDYRDAVERLFNSTDGKKLHKHDFWCSICPQLAKYECRNRNDSAPGVQKDQGCGLRLCGICGISLSQGYDNNLERMLADLIKNWALREFYPWGLRADANFLAGDGPLVKLLQLRSGSKQSA